MDKETIEKLVKSYIDQAIGGLEIENPKCDIKSKWYDLKSPKDINEFLKDTSAIANTFGLDGLIIIGYDLRSKVFTQATFADCKLSDTSQISDLINSKIDRLFDISVYDFIIDGNKLSVIHIPPSIDKPHVIRNYQSFDKKNNVKDEQQRIFVRRNTSTFFASKNDIELMFYDRKNIIPDYKILCSYHTDTLNFRTSSHHTGEKREITSLGAGINLVFENLGKRPVAIIEIKINFSFYEDPSSDEIMQFTTGGDYRNSEIIIQPNQIAGVTINLKSDFYKIGYETTIKRVDEFNRSKRNLMTNFLFATLSTGETLKCELKKVTA